MWKFKLLNRQIKYLTLSLPKVGQSQSHSAKISNFHFQLAEKQIAPSDSAFKEVSFEW